MPKSVREDMVSPLHTPGVYTTPVAFISAFVFGMHFEFLRFKKPKTKHQ